MISLLSKQNLNILNRRGCKYHLAVAEKDYFLALVSKIIYDSGLRDKLVFKGGTAIHHCYLSQYRFSEDLDFTAIDKSVTAKDVKDVLEENDFLTVKKEYVCPNTIKFERVQYTGPLGLPNCLKIEIDCTQNVVLPALAREYKNVWGVLSKVMVMDACEICAEKIRACSGRARYRDFYDLFLMFEEIKPSWNNVIDLIKQKEMRSKISKESIFRNWQVALQEKAVESAQIHYSRQINDESIRSFIESFPFAVINK